MAMVELSRSEEWELESNSQDVRGWEVVDTNGQRLGTVRDLIIDTERERVSMLVLDSGQQLLAGDVSIGDNCVRLENTHTAGTIASETSGMSSSSSPSSSTPTGGSMGSGVSSGLSESRDLELSGSRSREQELGSGSVERLPVIEEQLRVGKRTVETGGVRVNTRIEETPVEEEVRLREERVSVERQPVDRPVTESDVASLDGRSIEVRETAEEAIVDKQARVVEEVIVRKDVEEHTERIQETVRSTDVDVEKLGRADVSSQRPSNIQDPGYGTTGGLSTGSPSTGVPDPTLREPGGLDSLEEERRRQQFGSSSGSESPESPTGRL